MTPTIYTLPQDGDIRVSHDFFVREFASKCGSKKVVIHPDLPPLLQLVRDYFGQPVIILSGYRSPEHNRRVGGAKHSYHTQGMAADIRIGGVSPIEIYRCIENGWTGIDPAKVGMGLYTHQGFVHLDCRGERARW